MESRPNNIAEILNRIAYHDDEKAFGVLFNIYHGKMIETARFYINDSSLAGEIVSDVFVKVWKNRSKLDTINNIGSYLFVATKRQSLNFIRNRKKLQQIPLGSDEVNTFVEIMSPEKVLISREFEQVLIAAVNDLPSKCRLVYSLVKDEGMKYQEVADVLNISVKTVEMHIGKALKRIRLAFDNQK